jgi:hypothetical protein
MAKSIYDLYSGGTEPKQPSTPTPGIPAIKSPSVKQSQTIARFNTNWQARVLALKQAKGINLSLHVKPVWQDDMNRVKQGKRPYTNAQVLDFVHALSKGTAPVSPKSQSHGGLFGFVGNAFGDIGSIAQGLNPMNLVPALAREGVGAESVLTRIVGEGAGLFGKTKKVNGKTVTVNTGLTNFLDSLQTWVPGYTSAEKKRNQLWDRLEGSEKKQGVLHATGEAASNLPGIRMVPGTYTAGNILSGNAQQLAQHPLFTLLDVLPIAGHVGEAAAGLKFGAAAGDVGKAVDEGIIAKGSAWESLANGNPLQAGTRGAGITGAGSPIENLARSVGVSKDIREAARYDVQAGREAGIGPRFVEERTKRQAVLDQASKAQAAIEDKIKSQGGEATARDTMDLTLARKATQTAARNIARIGPADFIHHLWTTGVSRPLVQSAIDDGTHISLSELASRMSVNKEFKNILTNGQEDLLKEQMVPKYLSDPILSMHKSKPIGLFGKAFKGTTNAFKYAVLVGPRHSIHVMFSNGMFIALDDMKAASPSRLVEAWNMMKDPANWPAGLQRGLGIGLGDDILNRDGTINTDALKRLGVKAEDIHALQQGKTLGRMIKELPKNIASPFRHFEEFVTDFSRALEYLYGRDKTIGGDENIRAAEAQVEYAKSLRAPGVKNTALLGKAQKALERAKQGAMDAGGHEAGLNQVLKVLMDIDGMSPFERQTMRQIMPFYPFTRQILRYMAKFPAEHPMKAAVLAAVGRIEMQDAASGLPTNMMSLFPITGTDSNGNALFIDTKNMNPFRSANGLAPWTMAGFLSELNPMLTAPIESRGFNTLTATPELYPNLTVDPNTGDLVSKPSQNVVQTVAENIFPQLQTIDAMLGYNKQLQQIRQNDPEAYARVIWNNLNMPFTTGTRNIANARIRYARNLYNVAASQASQAVKSGDVSSLNYNYVPYGGNIYSVDQLKKALSGSSSR